MEGDCNLAISRLDFDATFPAGSTIIACKVTGEELVAWVWYSQRDNKNPWLWRVILGLAIILAWFIPWYLQRNNLILWPFDNVFETLGLGLASVIILFFGLYLWGRIKRGKHSESE
jgi:hypothetical protein